jgi:tetratricopeptide (TPR) repeat protein
VLPKEQILAVLPFAPLELDPKLTALGQGLVESVAAKLGRLTEQHSLEVIPARNMQEKGIASLEDARKQFGANLGLKVTLRQTTELISVSYSLTDAQTGRTLGADSITVPATDVFAVEDSVAAGAVKALQLQLRPEEEAALKGHGTSQAAAYNYYLQARGYLLNYSLPENLQNATIMLQEALKLDSNFGSAKAALGETYWRQYSRTKEKQWTVEARNECEQAVTLGNAGAAGHGCLGLIYDGTGKYAEAATEYQRAVELDASDENAYLGLALALEHQGAIDKAEQTLRSTVDAHPKSWIAYNALGLFYNRRNEFEKAVEMLKKVTELAPEGYAAYVNLGAIYNNMGRYTDAIPSLTKSIAIRPTYAASVNLGTAYYGKGLYREAAAAYEQAIRLEPKQYASWGNLGDAYYYGGSKAQALPAYRKASEMAAEELKVNPHDPDLLSDLASYNSMLGDRGKALSYLEQSLRYGHNDKGILLNASVVHNQLGETGLALEWLSKALQQGYPADKVRGLPDFANLADNPRFQELVGKVQASR